MLAGFLLCSGQFSRAEAPPVNIALGKTVTLNMPSNQSYTIDKDPAQLTDGKYGGNEYDPQNKTSTLWVQKGALTWRVVKKLLIITIDLGQISPISGVSYSTAGGRAGVLFPTFAGILVSDDAKLWHYEGDLISLLRKSGAPDPRVYSKYRFVTHDLKTKGRYLALAIEQTPYAVTDEIEVYAGENSWLNLPPNPQTFGSVDEILIPAFEQRRVTRDIIAVQKVLANSALSATAKSTFAGRLNTAARENEVLRLEDQSIKTTLPINQTHREVMAIYGEILAAEGIPLTIWKRHRYAWLPFIARPEKGQPAAIRIDLLKNEFRSDALLLTNASGKEKAVMMQLKNPPANAGDGWLQVSAVAWTDTRQGVPVADALLPITPAQGKYALTIPAGFTGKLWFTVDASKVTPGDYQSTFVIDGQQVPFHLSVAKVAMQRPRMSLTMWDNSDNKSLASGASRGITAANKAAALALMKSHFVDAPWAYRSILPWPKAEDFDAADQLTQPLDFSDLDQWVKEWPQARIFFVFVNVHENEGFAGGPLGSEKFNARVGAYAKALGAHMKELGLKPQQLSLLLIDEPGIHGDWEEDVIADWANAIHAAAPELGLVSDPAMRRPDLQKNQDALTQMNVLMPNTQNYVNSLQEAWDYYQQQRVDGRELWLYSAVGPVRLFDPQHYYRGQAWRVFSIGGRGMGFWSFNDIVLNLIFATPVQHQRRLLIACPAFCDCRRVF
jgi:hypothetical protein